MTALGVMLMCTRLLFGASDAMAESDHLIGCLIITVSVTAFAEIARPLRFLNVPMGAWLIAAPFVLQGTSTIGTFTSIAIGTTVMALSLPRGKLSGEHYRGVGPLQLISRSTASALRYVGDIVADRDCGHLDLVVG